MALLLLTSSLAAFSSSPAFRTVITGSGFWADAFDLFVIEGVSNVLKGLGPAVPVKYNGTTFYFTDFCDGTTSCLKNLRSDADGTWVPNPASRYSPEMEPRYQAQTTEGKSAVANAALIGSVLGQLAFGLAGDALGRKWCFVLSSLLLILGCLGSASAMAGFSLRCASYVGGMCASSAAVPTSSWDDVYVQLAIWRGILGFGVGGEYPLASTITSEGAGAKGSSGASRGRAVATIFSMQGWGKLAAAVLNYAVISTSTYYGGSLSFDGTWRVALACGCIPNLLTLYFRWQLHESAIFSKAHQRETGGAGAADGERIMIITNERRGSGSGSGSARGAGDKDAASAASPGGSGSGAGAAASALAKVLPVAPLSLRTTLALLWEYRLTLLGTASTWFLLDVTFYGQGLMNTSVVQNAVVPISVTVPMDKLLASLVGSVWIVMIALPGYWLAVWTIDSIGRFRLQAGGFFTSALVFMALAGFYNTPLRTSAGGAGYVILYGLTYLFANWGPNTTTFVLPSEAFPTRARSTAHGISAAMGKLGATAGSFGLLAHWYSFCTSSRDSQGAPNCSLSSSLPSESDAGIISVMWICAGVCGAGLLLTLAFTRETRDKTLEEVDAGSKVLARLAQPLPDGAHELEER